METHTELGRFLSSRKPLLYCTRCHFHMASPALARSLSERELGEKFPGAQTTSQFSLCSQCALIFDGKEVGPV